MSSHNKMQFVHKYTILSSKQNQIPIWSYASSVCTGWWCAADWSATQLLREVEVEIIKERMVKIFRVWIERVEKAAET